MAFQIDDHNIFGRDFVVIHRRGAHRVQAFLTVEDADVAGSARRKPLFQHLDAIGADQFPFFS
jgi:hypothetical protein